MASCGKCLHKEVCVDYRYYKPIAEKCQHFKEFNVDKKPQTNADRIRAMNDEELEELLQDAYNAGSDDAEAWHFGEGHRYSFEWDLKWLQSPAE